MVRLTADNLLVAGARFEVKAADEAVLETWTMKTGDDGADEHTLATSASRLQNCFMQWRINTCSMHHNVDAGTVAVTVGQDGVNRPVVPPTVYELTDVPQCSAGNATQIDDSLDWVVA
ncbi:MAG TPA: hypothetical protein VFJ16_00585 [Longimicrobium sp.]|nr:hypothetical protein [Longimicrobium sp.]